jgi:hypothetical protein
LALGNRDHAAEESKKATSDQATTAAATTGGMMGEHDMTGTIARIDHQSGVVKLESKTARPGAPLSARLDQGSEEGRQDHRPHELPERLSARPINCRSAGRRSI